MKLGFVRFTISSLFLNFFLDGPFAGVMILSTKTASSLFRPRCSTCLQEVQRGFLMRKVNEHALRCASRLNGRSLFFFFGGFWVVVFLLLLFFRAALWP